jgi:serine protease inhibitor
MIMSRISFAILLSATLSWQCQKEDHTPGETSTLDCVESPDLCQLSQTNNEFAFNIFRRLHQSDRDSNLFISPTSIATALTMTLNGAQGTTADEMRQTLTLNGLSQPAVNAAYQTLIDALPNLDHNVSVDMANSIWYRQGFPVKPPFLNTNETFFRSQVNPLDFRSPNAVNTINNWVSNKTRGLIPTIIERIPDNAIMYLINAIYFKGDWRMSFKPAETQNAPFYRTNQPEVSVKMMGFGENVTLPLYTTDAYYAVDLPYGDSVFSMTVLIPRGSNTLEDILNQLDGSSWQQIVQQLHPQEINFRMPKFSMDYEKTLNSVLSSMGMPTAFVGGAADFSGIADAELYIDEVKHKSIIEVTEKGTKAAAVTSIGIAVTSVPIIPVIRADRPFLFAIRENQAGNILFLGKLVQP